MKYLFFFSLVLISTNSIGQSVAIASIEVLPQNPTTNDEIFLATHTATGNMGLYLGSNVDVTGSSVSVQSCYFEGWATSPQSYYDTISIGYLDSGQYNLNYTAFISWISTDCDYYYPNSEYTTFHVQGFASVEEMNGLQVSISPNPSTGSVKVVSAEQIERISIVDIAGKVVFETDVNGFDAQLQLNSLTSGVYLVKVFSGTEISTKRMILK